MNPADACDPRVARSRAAVLEATLALLGEVGHAGTTIDAIAERSGVAKTTVYRHWPSRAPLLLDAFHSVVEPEALAPTGDVRADLVALARGLAAKLRDRRWSRIMATLIDAAESDPDIAELSTAFSRRRRRAVQEVIERGIAEGDLDPGLDPRLAAQLVGGTLFYQRLIAREPAEDDQVERVVDLVLAGLRRRP